VTHIHDSIKHRLHRLFAALVGSEESVRGSGVPQGLFTRNPMRSHDAP
jgi:hypothetical protein